MVNAFVPQTLDDALRIRGENDVRIFAGGTDLMVMKKRGGGLAPNFERPVLFMGRVPECRGIIETGGGLRIGSMTTLAEIEADPRTPKLLRQAVAQMAAIAVRNVATLGGNIAHASPAGDTLPPLYVMDAAVILARMESGSPREREMPLEEFITGRAETRLEKDEIITAIRIPGGVPEATWYRKIATRRAAALSKVSFAAQATVRDGVLEDLRMAVGACAPTVIRSRELEAMAIGVPADRIGDVAAKMKAGYADLLSPIDDQRSTKEYRRGVALRLIEQFVTVRAWRPDGKGRG